MKSPLKPENIYNLSSKQISFWYALWLPPTLFPLPPIPELPITTPHWIFKFVTPVAPSTEMETKRPRFLSCTRSPTSAGGNSNFGRWQLAKPQYCTNTPASCCARSLGRRRKCGNHPFASQPSLLRERKPSHAGRGQVVQGGGLPGRPRRKRLAWAHPRRAVERSGSTAHRVERWHAEHVAGPLASGSTR